jgi:erythrin-vacuolar iron transport family protein
MGFAEALSDDGSITGRGRPWFRGLVCGVMAAVGGIGHSVPVLISNFEVALIVAALVVLLELGFTSWIRHRYMERRPSLLLCQLF